MRAVLLLSPEKLVLTEKEEEPVGHGEVKVAIRAVGICGSDLHTFKGLNPNARLPVIMGHEIAGEVAEIGGGVIGAEVGDRVVIEPLLRCGKCFHCVRGDYNRCTDLKIMGVHSDGGFCEYVVVKESMIYELPKEMTYAEGAMVEPTAASVHAAIKRGRIDLGESVAILGSGTIGLLLLQIVKACGASFVLVTDVVESRLKVARRLGADLVVDVREEDPVKLALEQTGGLGVDVAFEAVGKEVVLKQALQMTRAGGRVIIIGIYGRPSVKIDVMKTIFNKELVMKGSRVYSSGDFDRAIDLIRRREINVEPLLTHLLPLEETEKGIKLMIEHKEKAIKVHLKP
ncbi:TPA: butanediol dehydrogenase [Candidatus Bathyarchaeota archaeon]|nr:butanediol dehydrogenase [Candidatus Bathyarchaeota archaeon]